MENYKIRVNNEAESKETQELFEKLGYKIEVFIPAGFPRWVATTDSGEDYWYCTGFDLVSKLGGFQELSLPQLRDLVVLKCNDSRDANVNQGGEIPCLYDLYLTADKELYFYHCGKGKWLLSNLNHDEDYYATLKPIEKSEHQAPALISGADAELVAQAKKFITSDHLNRFEAAEAHLEGHPVQFMLANGDFIDITSDTTLGIFEKDGGYSFRLKPQTIKVELEIPAPYKAKIGGRDDTSFVLNVGRHQYCYNNEEDYTKARDALEAVFDAAVRGTNS
ncbi:hypothetical protein [Acinetobacter baumannii]|uniref:hypothetical protein n=1 Tax=Acinetobacter baumannii TaxID=470 RepID=UPI00112C1EC0|nr:hypothetical protein [Acinetobacter baumannii]TPS83279.1 hypothetical protein FJU80_03815 [Acinetobacter baumannii]TPT54275.1 hypothetical protein FJU64_12835 [Acinetobacter baumannii]